MHYSGIAKLFYELLFSSYTCPDPECNFEKKSGIIIIIITAKIKCFCFFILFDYLETDFKSNANYKGGLV